MIKKFSLKMNTFTVNKYLSKKYIKLALLRSNFWKHFVIYFKNKRRLFSFKKYLDGSIYLYSEKIILLLSSVVIPI